MRDFEKYYPGPYKTDEFCGWVICTAPNDEYIHAWDWLESKYTSDFDENEFMSLLLDRINGENLPIPIKYNFKASTDDPCIIECNGEAIICMRGWGMLCGPGGHNLPEEQAAKIQDSFRDYIIKRLNCEI